MKITKVEFKIHLDNGSYVPMELNGEHIEHNDIGELIRGAVELGTAPTREADPPCEECGHIDDPRPDFQGFIDKLKDEACWMENLYREGSGEDRADAESDAKQLRELAASVAAVGKNTSRL